MPLSQDQIDALLGGGGGSAVAGSLGPADLDALAGLGAHAFNAGATAASQALGRTVTIGDPQVALASLDELKRDHAQAMLVVHVDFTVASRVDHALLLKERDGAILFDLLMGRDGKNPQNPDVGELEIGAVGEIMNQVMGNAATAMSQKLATKVDVAPPQTKLAKLADGLPSGFGSELVKLTYRLQIEDLPDSELVQVFPVAAVSPLLGQRPSAPPPAPAPAAAMTPPATAPQPMMAAPPPTAGSGYYASQPLAAPGAPVAVQPVQFSPLAMAGDEGLMPSSLDLVLDIPLRVTVELGGTRIKIKDVLELGRGSVVELNRLAGEPVDLLVNGKLMAKGEVVVINENFGLRITEIVGRAERMSGLNLK